LFADKNFSLRVQSRAARWFSFKPKIPIWVKSWRALDRKMLSYFMTIKNVLLPFGITFGRLVLSVVIWYIFSRFGMFGPRKIWQPWSRKRERERELRERQVAKKTKGCGVI
jgi:hypothetical protein